MQIAPACGRQGLRNLPYPLGQESTHSTPRSEARGMLRVDTERRFHPQFKNRGLAPSNVSKGSNFSDLLYEFLLLFFGDKLRPFQHEVLCLCTLIPTSLRNGGVAGVHKEGFFPPDVSFDTH